MVPSQFVLLFISTLRERLHDGSSNAIWVHPAAQSILLHLFNAVQKHDSYRGFVQAASQKDLSSPPNLHRISQSDS